MARSTLAAALLIVACGSPLGPGLDTDALMVTDAQEYRLSPDNSGAETVISYTYSNRTGASVAIPNCLGDVTPHLEKFVDDAWVVAWSSPKLDCLSAPVTIGEGSQYRDELRLPADGRGFVVSSITGTYRLVWGTLVWDYDEGGPPWGDPVPLAQRVSNHFGLIES